MEECRSDCGHGPAICRFEDIPEGDGPIKRLSLNESRKLIVAHWDELVDYLIEVQNRLAELEKETYEYKNKCNCCEDYCPEANRQQTTKKRDVSFAIKDSYGK